MIVQGKEEIVKKSIDDFDYGLFWRGQPLANSMQIAVNGGHQFKVIN
jgi:hypothetical protein